MFIEERQDDKVISISLYNKGVEDSDESLHAIISAVNR